MANVENTTEAWVQLARDNSLRTRRDPDEGFIALQSAFRQAVGEGVPDFTGIYAKSKQAMHQG
eukprot:11135793-Prorocentrum_lima.AAC.1